MSTLSPEHLADLLALPEAERLALADRLWASVEVPLPQDVIDEYERRLADAAAHPETLRPADDVVASLRARLDRR